MVTEFGEGSRYDAAMKAVEDFLSYRKGDALGLSFFGNSVLHWCPLTSDVSAIRCAPPFMRPENVPPWFNGIEIGKALRACKALLVERQERAIARPGQIDNLPAARRTIDHVACSHRHSGVQLPQKLAGLTGRVGNAINEIQAAAVISQ